MSRSLVFVCHSKLILAGKCGVRFVRWQRTWQCYGNSFLISLMIYTTNGFLISIECIQLWHFVLIAFGITIHRLALRLVLNSEIKLFEAISLFHRTTVRLIKLWFSTVTNGAKRFTRDESLDETHKVHHDPWPKDRATQKHSINYHDYYYYYLQLNFLQDLMQNIK